MSDDVDDDVKIEKNYLKLIENYSIEWWCNFIEIKKCHIYRVRQQ